MPKKLDAQKIEKARQKPKTKSAREIEKERFHKTIEQNRKGERHGYTIEPDNKLYAYQEEDKKTRVAAYCRVSTQEEAQVGSFEMQKHHYQQVIEGTPNYELVKIYADDGISGTQIHKRKGFQDMLADAQEGKMDLILTKSISRFGRNAADVLNSILMLNSLNPPVAVRFENENLTTSDPASKVLITVLSALAEMESQMRSENIKFGIRHRMSEGMYKFSVTNLIGYYRDYTGALKIAPEEAEIVSYIYQCCLEGYSPSQIAQALTEQGISSPKGKERWTPATIKSILTNEKYVGDVLYQKTFSLDHLSHKSIKNKKILRQYFWGGHHTGIIDRATWTQAQLIMKERRWARGQKLTKNMEKKFTVSIVKRGLLRGYFLLDMSWNRQERKQFIELIKSYMESDETQERN